jgi:hypothetical protein
MTPVNDSIVAMKVRRELGGHSPFTRTRRYARLADMTRLLAALLVVLLTGCAAPRDGERTAARWVGEFPGKVKTFAACLESRTPQTMAARTVHYDAVKRADVIVTPPPYHAIADHEITVAQAAADKVRVVFQHRTAMDFGQTEQHVRSLAGVCGKAA